MRRWWRRHPLLAVAVALTSAYIGMAEWNRGDSGPRTFIAALAAVALGAWLYSVARDAGYQERDRERPADDEAPTAEWPNATKPERRG